MQIVDFGNGYGGIRRNVLCIPRLYKYLDIIDARTGRINWRWRGQHFFDDCKQPMYLVNKVAADYQIIIDRQKEAERLRKLYYKGIALSTIVPSFCDKARAKLYKLIGRPVPVVQEVPQNV